MIQRWVLMKLRADHDSPEGRDRLRGAVRQIMPRIPQVRGLSMQEPADDGARVAWDLAMVVELESLSDFPLYRDHPEHVAFRETIDPLVEVLKAWNFQPHRLK